MQNQSSSRRATQLALFQAVLKAPRWEQLPWEIRQQTVQLLARILSEHSERMLASKLTAEARDE